VLEMAKREPPVRIPLPFEDTLKDLLRVKPPAKDARKSKSVAREPAKKSAPR
jgi:hypothetical protein